jgi:hypothetical protein
MNYKFETIHTPDYLIVKISGVLDADNLITMADDFIAVITNSEHYKVLVDTRQLELKTSVIEDHHQAEHIATQLLGIKHRIALLGPSHYLQENTFFETVSVNRGVNLLTFTKEEDAINYLMKGTS